MKDWLRRQPIAHRGLHGGGVPENSLGAFAAAVAAGFAIELDVRLSADGVPVVFHDERLERLTGAVGLVGERTMAGLRSLRLLGSGEPVPSLGEVLALVRGRAPVLVEVKAVGRDRWLERRCAGLLRRYRGAFAVQSFDPAAVRRLKRLLPSAPCGLLLEAGRRVPGWVRVDFVACDVRGLTVSPARSPGVPLILWTVRTGAEHGLARRVRANVIFEGSSGALPHAPPRAVARGTWDLVDSAS